MKTSTKRQGAKARHTPKPSVKGQVTGSLRRKAARIIKSRAAYPANILAAVTDALTNNPGKLPQLIAQIEQANRDADDFGRGAHTFAHGAYSAALDFYSKHYDNPAALSRFTEALRG